MKYSRLRGTQDIVPPEIETWRAVETAFQNVFDLYGYRGIRTPIIEPTDLFVRAVGEGSDIVSKEMYTFADRGGRSVTLRPENTASVIRAYSPPAHSWALLSTNCGSRLRSMPSTGMPSSCSKSQCSIVAVSASRLG